MIPLYDAGLPNDQPQTHALIIGVNDYAHLPGGSQHALSPAPRNFGLNQLTSPSVSATGLVDWLLAHHNNPAARLGSVDLLLSPAKYFPNDAAAQALGVALGSGRTVAEATFSNIKNATAQWYLRANRARENVALFYFCGHGLEASDQYLLPADFGANPLDWADNIINFTTTYRNLERCRAKTQCFFLDACRDRPSELQMQAAMGAVGQPLIGRDPSSSVLERDAPVYLAAAPRQSAAGPIGQMSYFTSALIACLNGMGARRPGSKHAPVDYESLRSALRELVDRLAEDHGLPLRCAVSGECVLPQPVELHYAPVPVKVLASITCDPPQAHQIAQLSLLDSQGHSKARTTFDDRPWRFDVTAGKCKIEAQFDPDSAFAGLAQEEIINPPVFRLRLNIPQQQAGGGGAP